MAETFNKDMNIIAQSDIEVQIDPITKDMNIIQKLDDEPNDVGGLTAAQLKAKFDEGGNALKEYINGSLIPQVLGAEATEAAREANEAQRQANETARQTAETGRVQAENARVQAEAGRQSAETARAAAETAREAAFTQDQADRAAAFTAAQDAMETAFETAQTEQAAAFQTAQTQRETAFTQAQTSREAAFTAAQQSQEDRFQAAEEARDLWEDYDNTKAYVPGNKVYYQGSSYVNTAACQGVLPTDTAHWQIVAKKGADGEGSFTQDQADQRYLQLSGGTMMGTLKLFGLPIDPEDAVPLTYVDALIPETVVSSFKGRDGEVTPRIGDYTADMVGAYTQAQCISANTRTLLGLGSTATPDQALAALKRRTTAPPGNLVIFTSSGTFSPSTYGLIAGDKITIICVGGGGGGGGGAGAPKSPGFSGGDGGKAGNGSYAGTGFGAGGGGGYGGPGNDYNSRAGGGGGGGGYVVKTDYTLLNTNNFAVTVGKAGTGGAGGSVGAVGVSGTAGGTSSFGSVISAAGGNGGYGASANMPGSGGAGGGPGGGGGRPYNNINNAPGYGGGGGGGFLVSNILGVGEGGEGGLALGDTNQRGSPGSKNTFDSSYPTSGDGVVIVMW